MTNLAWPSPSFLAHFLPGSTPPTPWNNWLQGGLQTPRLVTHPNAIDTYTCTNMDIYVTFMYFQNKGKWYQSIKMHNPDDPIFRTVSRLIAEIKGPHRILQSRPNNHPWFFSRFCQGLQAHPKQQVVVQRMMLMFLKDQLWIFIII